MRILPKIAIPILMLGVASSLGANPVKQFQQQNVYVKQRRFVEDNGYPVQAVAVDVRGAQYPYIYQRSAVGDAVAEEEIYKRLEANEAEIAALKQRVEDLIRILSGNGENGGTPDGGAGGAGADELTLAFATIVKENCQTCHSPKNSEGDLTFFNDKGNLWVKKVGGEQPRDLTAREWNKLGRLVEIGKMPKGDKKLNNEQKDKVADFVDKQLEILEGNK